MCWLCWMRARLVKSYHMGDVGYKALATGSKLICSVAIRDKTCFMGDVCVHLQEKDHLCENIPLNGRCICS
jgi:hypothetical protein